MHPEYTFLNIVHRHSTDTTAFPTPSKALKRSVRIGDVVTLLIAKKRNQQTDDPFSVETLRVRVDGLNWPMFDAVALAPLDLQKYHGVNVGDTCCFEEHHIMDVLNSKDPYARQKSVAIAQFAAMSREFLEELAPADLPQNRTTLSELDEFTTVLINRKGGMIDALVAVEVERDGYHDSARTNTKRYSTSFYEAANRLGIPNLPPDDNHYNPIKRLNQLMVRFSTPGTGLELIETIYAKIEMVRQESQKVVEMQS